MVVSIPSGAAGCPLCPVSQTYACRRKTGDESRKGWHAPRGGRAYGAGSFSCNGLQHLDEEGRLCRRDPLLQRVGGVARQDRHLALGDDGAVVVFAVDQMDRDAADGLPGGQNGFVHAAAIHAAAAEFRQQGRVDVQDPALISG